mmetsp:Transcript_23866/g.39460  ORF Transcript_23866/g.39460 Transcript_23866/m.39460 type:complete len:96 (-) Transcript_23866:90-377(-)
MPPSVSCVAALFRVVAVRIGSSVKAAIDVCNCAAFCRCSSPLLCMPAVFCLFVLLVVAPAVCSCRRGSQFFSCSFGRCNSDGTKFVARRSSPFLI